MAKKDMDKEKSDNGKKSSATPTKNEELTDDEKSLIDSISKLTSQPDQKKTPPESYLDEIEDEPTPPPPKKSSEQPKIELKPSESQIVAETEKTIMPIKFIAPTKSEKKENPPIKKDVEKKDDTSSSKAASTPNSNQDDLLKNDINTYKSEQDFADRLKLVKKNINKKPDLIKKGSNEPPKSLMEQRKQRENDYLVSIRFLVNGRMIEKKVNPNIDKVFVFICQGYDRVKKRSCYRYLRDLTLTQVEQFKLFIRKYGCICEDRDNHQVTIISAFDELVKMLPLEPVPYETEFISEYMKRLSFATLVDDYENDELVKSIDTKEHPEPNRDEEIEDSDQIPQPPEDSDEEKTE